MSEIAAAGGFERIVVEVGRDGLKQAFQGRWLVEPHDDNRTSEEGQLAGYAYGVARTQKGQIAAYSYRVRGGDARLDTYLSFEAALSWGFPENIIARARAVETGEKYIRELDI